MTPQSEHDAAIREAAKAEERERVLDEIYNITCEAVALLWDAYKLEDTLLTKINSLRQQERVMGSKNRSEEPPLFKSITSGSRWYRNCKQQRKKDAKICESCPFKEQIETAEKQILT